MDNSNLEISITHLYPKYLNLYGDRGNILTLINRCKWRGIDIVLSEVDKGEAIPPSDIYFIGGGQDKQQEEIAQELFKHKNFLQDQRDKDSVFLGICGGYQLFGHYYQPHNKDRLQGISLINAYTIAGKKRHIGNVTVKTNFLTPNTLVGFENHSGLTYIEEGTLPLGIVEIGNGNNDREDSEGCIYKNVFGTYLHGSLLPKNPHFADYLIELALKKKYNDNIKLTPLNDNLELFAHNRAVGKKY